MFVHSGQVTPLLKIYLRPYQDTDDVLCTEIIQSSKKKKTRVKNWKQLKYPVV